MKTFLAWVLRKQLCDNIHKVYYFANHILSIFCMLATYKLKQIMWRTTISVQYFTAQVPEKISKLKAEVKLTRRSCFNKWSPLTLPALQRLVTDLSIVRLPELEDIGRPRGWLNFFCFLPSDAPWPFQTAVLVAPCEPVHQTTQKDRQSSVICWENPFNVSVKIHSLRELAVDEIMLKFRGRFMGKPYMSKKPTKWGT